MPSSFSFQTLLPSLVAALGIALLLWLVSFALVKTIRGLGERLEAREPENAGQLREWTAQLATFVRRACRFVTLLAVSYILARSAGLGGLPEISWDRVGQWLSTRGIKILAVLAGAYLLSHTVSLLLLQLPFLLPHQMGSRVEAEERRQRVTTISHLLNNVVAVGLTAVAGLIVLREVGFDITPILTGLGIGGLALGFGAQHLVRDLITGFFIILENHVAVGDVAVINGKGGQVESIRLRTIVLRGLDGTVHVFPNGTIEQISNMTKHFSYYVLNLGVAYKEDTDRVVAVAQQVASELRADPAYSHDILEDLEVLGVDDFADSAVMLKMRIKTAPIRQWAVGRELRRRIKKAFDAQGIEIPFPHLSVYVGESSKPFAVQMLEQARRPA